MRRSRYVQSQQILWGLLLLFFLLTPVLLAACGSSSTGNPPSSSNTGSGGDTGGNRYGGYGNTGAATPSASPTSSTSPQATQAQAGSGSSPTVQVKIIEQNGQYLFEPATITVSKGTKVVWTNSSDAPHTVTGDNNSFGSKDIFNENQTYSATFNTAGTFTYHCEVHPYMKGTVTVTA